MRRETVYQVFTEVFTEMEIRTLVIMDKDKYQIHGGHFQHGVDSRALYPGASSEGAYNNTKPRHETQRHLISGYADWHRSEYLTFILRNSVKISYVWTFYYTGDRE